MDSLTRLMSGLRGQGLFALQLVMAPPWCVDVADEAPLAVIAVCTGSAWLRPAAGHPVHLTPGTVAVISHGVRYEVGDTVDRRPTVRIDPGGECVPLLGQVRTTTHHGLLTWGNDVAGPDRMIVGTYTSRTQVSDHLTAQLPDFLILPPDEVDPALLSMLARELAAPEAGHSMAIDRLLDLVVCSALRSAPIGTRGGHHDPVAAGALELMHRSPEQPWTVDSLATELHVSRATLAARFRSSLGTPPGTYLTGWRLTLAADALVGTDDSLEKIARRVGYSSGFALSAAFTRRHRMRPGQYRRTVRSTP